jgi:hypothetical protein
VHPTETIATKGKSTYVSRKIDVARMDEFIGPKA